MAGENVPMKNEGRMSMSESVLVPGMAEEWRDFEVADYDPKAPIGSDEDALGEFLAERSAEDLFGVVLVLEPTATMPNELIMRMSGSNIPTKVRRESREESKGGKKEKKHKKD
jgi:hypothetical protein